MTAPIIQLTSAYVVLAVLLLSLNLRSAWAWPVKAGGIVLTSVFYAVTYFGFHGLLGWPARDELPDRFKLLAADVREPERGQGDSGAIYLWVRDWRQPEAAPRGYRMDYSGRLHELIEQTRETERRGTPQLGERVGAKPYSSAQAGGAGIRFVDQPRRSLPPK